MSLKRAIPILTALAVTFWACQANALSIDDAWPSARKSCDTLRAFKNRYGTNNRFAEEYAKRERSLKCGAKAPPSRSSPDASSSVARREQDVAPRADRSPAQLKSSVILDANGRGDTTILADALKMVATNGEILVYPGTYTGEVRVTRSVTIRGMAAANQPRPVIDGSSATSGVLNIVDGNVRLEGLGIRSTGAIPVALFVVGGALHAERIFTEWRPAPGSLGRAYQGTVRIQSGNRVTLTDVDIGPGSQLALVLDGAKDIVISNSLIRHPTSDAVFANNSVASITKSTIVTPKRAIIAQNSAVALDLVIIGSLGATSSDALSAVLKSTIRIRSSLVCTVPYQIWNHTDSTSTLDAKGVFNATGVLISAAGDADLRNAAKEYCAPRKTE